MKTSHLYTFFWYPGISPYAIHHKLQVKRLKRHVPSPQLFILGAICRLGSADIPLGRRGQTRDLPPPEPPTSYLHCSAPSIPSSLLLPNVPLVRETKDHLFSGQKANRAAESAQRHSGEAVGHTAIKVKEKPVPQGFSTQCCASNWVVIRWLFQHSKIQGGTYRVREGSAAHAGWSQKYFKSILQIH